VKNSEKERLLAKKIAKKTATSSDFLGPNSSDFWQKSGDFRRLLAKSGDFWLKAVTFSEKRRLPAKSGDFRRNFTAFYQQ